MDQTVYKLNERRNRRKTTKHKKQRQKVPQNEKISVKSAKIVASVVIGKGLETTAQEHWKFPPKTFLITADGTDYTDCAENFRFD